jgi:MFS family permease
LETSVSEPTAGTIPYASRPAPTTVVIQREATSWSELTSVQKKSGLAAWLGWLFDGLDMHLYTVVATPFVAELLRVPQNDPQVGRHAAWIQGSFLVGWALGGAFFGRIGDLIGRSRALVLTILTYALFTGLSCIAREWWHLLAFRFLAALGIGGEWAVGASLLSETWPKRWRPWIAAVLQTAVNVGIIVAMVAVFFLSAYPPRYVFLVGILPALIVVWIRKAVPEPAEWHAAKAGAIGAAAPSVFDLFRGEVRRTTLLTIVVCAFSLTAHWAFMFWSLQHLRTLPELKTWTQQSVSQFLTFAMCSMIGASIAGNFLAAAIARVTGYRIAIVAMCLAYFAAMLYTYSTPRGHTTLLGLLALIGVFQGLFGLFTMFLPPLFPTLLRTTGAGFCYNIGRIAAAFGTIYFGVYVAKAGQPVDYRLSLFYAAFLFLPAAVAVCFMSEPADERGAAVPEPVE